MKRQSEANDEVSDSGESAGPSKAKYQYSKEKMDEIGDDLGLKDRQMRKLRGHLNANGGRGTVEPGLNEHLVEKKNTFADFYSYEDIMYEGDKSIVTVYCSDIIGLIRKICVMRDLDYENCTKKVGIDGGKGFLKIVLSLFDDENPGNEGAGSKSYTGGRKVIPLVIAPNVSETYVNIKIMLDLIKFKLLDNYLVSGDLKVLNILGIMVI